MPAPYFRKVYLYWVFALLIFFFSFLMIRITIPYFSFSNEVDFLLVKQELLSNWAWRISFYTHIATSPLVLLAGVIQFYKPWQQKGALWHRRAGFAYTFAILFLAAPSGLVMAFYANGGWPARISFLLISMLWWFWTCRAILRIRKGDYKGHQADMYRSYALTLSAITLRLYVWLLPMISDIRGVEMYVLVSWMSWIPNLIVVERFLHRRIYS